jgi:hypothetical protein
LLTWIGQRVVNRVVLDRVDTIIGFFFLLNRGKGFLQVAGGMGERCEWAVVLEVERATRVKRAAVASTKDNPMACLSNLCPNKSIVELEV